MDINDVFDDILLCDNASVCRGFQEGLEDGRSKSLSVYWPLGVKYGAKLASEFCFYQSFVDGLLQCTAAGNNSCFISPAGRQLLAALQTALRSFTLDHVQSDVSERSLHHIRLQFRRLCSLIKIPPSTALVSSAECRDTLSF